MNKILVALSFSQSFCLSPPIPPKQSLHTDTTVMTCFILERERERGREGGGGREGERESTETLFYNDCSLGSVKNLSNN